MSQFVLVDRSPRTSDRNNGHMYVHTCTYTCPHARVHTHELLPRRTRTHTRAPMHTVWCLTSFVKPYPSTSANDPSSRAGYRTVTPNSSLARSVPLPPAVRTLLDMKVNEDTHTQAYLHALAHTHMRSLTRTCACTCRHGHAYVREPTPPPKHTDSRSWPHARAHSRHHSRGLAAT